MSNKALSYVFEHSKTKGSARVLMLTIADMANDDGECYPGKAKLAEKVNVSERQLTTLIRDCETLGELRVYQRSHTAEDHRTNKYYIVGLYDEKHPPKVRIPKARTRRKVDKIAEHRFHQLAPDSGTPLPVSDVGHRNTASGGHRKSASTNPSHITLTTTNTSRAGKAPAAVRTEPQSFATTSGKSDAELLATRDAVETEMRIDDDRRLHRNEQRALLTDMVTHLFNVSGPFAQKYVAMLEGRQLQNIRANAVWNEAAAYLKGAPVTADELYAWSKWYRQTVLGGNEKLSLTSKPEGLVSSILAYRETPTTPVRATGMFAGTNYDDTYWERQDAAKASAK